MLQKKGKNEATRANFKKVYDILHFLKAYTFSHYLNILVIRRDK